MASERASRRAVLLRMVPATAVICAILGLAAAALGEPFLFPTVGPTLFLLFYVPMSPMSAPRNVILGQAIGMLSGYLCVVLFGLREVPADLFNLSLARVGAIVLALSLSFTLMIWLGFEHPPAAATVLVVALGLLSTPLDLLLMMLAMAYILVSAFAVNRLAGIHVPVWAPRATPATPGSHAR